VVAYEDSAATGHTKIKARRWTGQAWGAGIIVAAPASSDASGSAVAVDPNSGAYLIAGGTSTGLLVRKYAGDQETNQVALVDTGLTASAAIAPVGGDAFALMYFKSAGSQVSVRVGYVNDAGTMTSPANMLATGKFPMAYRPAVAYGAGMLAAAWTESKGNSVYRVSARVFGL